MIISHRIHTFFTTLNFIWVGIAIAFSYWVMESFLHVLFFNGGRLIEQLLSPDIHEIWKRILVVCLLIFFGFFAEKYFSLRKQSEKALKESENKYRTIFEQALNPIFIFNNNGRFVDSNHAALLFLECSQDELLVKSLDDICSGYSSEQCIKNASLIHEGQIVEIDYQAGTQTKTILLNLVPLHLENNSLTYGIGQDITQRKKIEHTLKQAHAELDQIFQTASVGMRLVDKDYNILKINKTFADITDVTEEDAFNKKCYEIFSGPMCHTVNCPLARVIKGESTLETFVDKKRSDGKIIPCILTATPFTNQEGDVVGIVESFRDITELRKAHEIIHSERDKLHCILSHLLEGVCIVNANHVIEYQNTILRKELGDCDGQKCYSVFKGKSSPCNPCLMLEALGSGTNQIIEYETHEGRIFEQTYTRITDIDDKDKAVTILRDITAKKISLAAAMHADRLAAVGELATGVAHEINNPINGIINYAQIISNKTEKDDLVNNVANRMIKEGNRIASIVESLLTFARRQREGKTISSVNEILADSLALTTAQMRKDNISLKIELAENLPNIMAQPQEIEQVFINIINNARYALIQKYPATHIDKLLEIRTQLIEKNKCPHLRTAFHDHGIGIPENIIDKVKVPFFSTKPDGKCTGLGLAISHGIIESHGGELTIDSIEGVSTRVIIDLPAWQVVE